MLVSCGQAGAEQVGRHARSGSDLEHVGAEGIGSERTEGEREGAVLQGLAPLVRAEDVEVLLVHRRTYGDAVVAATA